jgi:outer membrane lipoprotein-sorting protein
MRNPSLVRWTPAVVVPAVIAAGALVGAGQAGAADLPQKTPEQVLAMVAGSDVHALSGTVQQVSNLGLPALPSSAGNDGMNLMTGSHTLRVYLDGATRSRVQVLDQLAERDAVRNGNDLWLYDSQHNKATHMTLPARSAQQEATPEQAPSWLAGAQTPQQVAQRLLAKVSPTTATSVAADTQVAGRSAYDLVLQPKATDTLVGAVSIAVDAQTGLPLRVRVTARGQQAPAVDVAYTSLDLATPPADRFAFTPPAGATVQTRTTTAQQPRAAERPDVTVIGTGWDAVLEVPASETAGLRTSPMLTQMTRAVPEGRALTSTLVNALVTNDGRVLVGSVPLSRLQTAAAGR